VTVDRVWIGNCIYWTLTDPWLQVIITNSLINTLYSSLEHTHKASQPACCVSTSLLVMASNGRRSSSSRFLNCPQHQLPASHSNSSQQLNHTGYLTHSLTHPPTNSLTPLTWLLTVLLIMSQPGPHRKHCSSVAMHLLLSARMTYSIVACAAIGTYHAENTIPLLPFMGHYLATGLHATILNTDYSEKCVWMCPHLFSHVKRSSNLKF
jgi:hypothetical protein